MCVLFLSLWELLRVSLVVVVLWQDLKRYTHGCVIFLQIFLKWWLFPLGNFCFILAPGSPSKLFGNGCFNCFSPGSFMERQILFLLDTWVSFSLPYLVGSPAADPWALTKASALPALLSQPQWDQSQPLFLAFLGTGAVSKKEWKVWISCFSRRLCFFLQTVRSVMAMKIIHS